MSERAQYYLSTKLPPSLEWVDNSCSLNSAKIDQNSTLWLTLIRGETDMPTQKIFYPDQALIFRSLPEEFQLIHAMGLSFNDFCSRGYPERESLYFAYVETHRNPHGIATASGAHEFYRRMTEYLRTAMDMVEHVIATYFRTFAERLPAHNSVANCLDTIQMLKLATSDPGHNPSSLERRRNFEAKRQLGIALQLFAIETADEESAVADDLSSIDQLTWERLFVPDESVDLWLIAGLNSARANRSENLELFRTHRQAKRRARERRHLETNIKEELLPSRVTNLGEKNYIVYVGNRRKRLLSTLLKLERGRPTGDRRGWKYVVVAVHQTGNELRLATRDDARVFHDHTHKTLWQSPLVVSPDPPNPNPHRHETYWDLKTLGRYHRADNGRMIAGSAEQLVTTIQDHLDTYVATDGLNHDLYRARQAMEFLGPLWFPHHRGPYDEVASMRLPGFGVDWDSPRLKEQLEHWWKNQL